MIGLDALGSVAVTTMITLAMVELHVELVAGAAAWLGAWCLLREPSVSVVGRAHGGEDAANRS